MAIKPCIGYIRVSTNKQVDVSPDAQRDRITQWANGSGHEVTAIYQDLAISGKETGHPICGNCWHSELHYRVNANYWSGSRLYVPESFLSLPR